MKVTDDLYNKEMLLSGVEIQANGPDEHIGAEEEQAFYRKLQAYLLLLYQSYLKNEATLEPDIRMAIWRMLRFDQEFLAKIQMAQQFYLSADNVKLDDDWDEVKERLFPYKSNEIEEAVGIKTEKLIAGYKEVVSELLQSQY